MKKITLFTIFAALFACKQNPKSNAMPDSTSEKLTESVSNDSLALQDLTRQLYQWLENEYSFEDFIPKKMDKSKRFYTEIDLDLHYNQMKILENSGFFSVKFINLYDEIGHNINYVLEEKFTQWHVGEIPPFGSGANQWCNCQDTPSEDYYQYITIKNINIEGNTATFAWTWGNAPEWEVLDYHIKAEKENGKWKITSLQGFEELNEKIRNIALK